jgi:rare lipoprotein A
VRASSLLLLFWFAGCAPRNQGFRPPVAAESTRDDSSGKSDPTSKTDLDFAKQAKAPADAKADQTGLATWYGSAFAGRKTANGERFDPMQLTAAHRTLPFGTWVEVRRVDTGRTVRVRITDRGPFGDSRRIIDLSKKAAEDLGIIRDGVAHVELRVVEGP